MRCEDAVPIYCFIVDGGRAMAGDGAEYDGLKEEAGRGGLEGWNVEKRDGQPCNMSPWQDLQHWASYGWQSKFSVQDYF